MVLQGRRVMPRINTAVCSPIRPHALYLGNFPAALDPHLLGRSNIRRIVSVTDEPQHRPDPEFCQTHGIEQKIFPIPDAPFADSEQKLAEDIFPWISKSEEERKPVLVHCRMGISRSPALVIAYLIWSVLNDPAVLSKMREDQNFVGDPFELAFGTALELVDGAHPRTAPLPEVLRSFLQAIGRDLPASYHDLYPTLRRCSQQAF